MSNARVPKRGTLRVMRPVGLPELLKRRRAELNDMSLREAARRAGLAVMTLRHIEEGDTKLPSRDYITALAEAYEIDEETIALAAYGLYFVEDDRPRTLTPSLDAVSVG